MIEIYLPFNRRLMAKGVSPLIWDMICPISVLVRGQPLSLSVVLLLLNKIFAQFSISSSSVLYSRISLDH